MTDTNIDNIVPLVGDARWLNDGFVNMLAGLGVVGRDKFASQQFVHVALNQGELEAAYRSDWIARKVVTIPAWDMTREWRGWQADPDQIELLEAVEKKLFVQQKLQQAMIKARLYGGACIIIGVDAGAPEEELDVELVTQDSLKFIHVVSRNQIRAGPIIKDISSKYFGQPEYYEARQEPPPKSFVQAEASTNPEFAKPQVKLHPSRVVKLIGMDTADQMLSDIWGDSVLQPVNDAVKMCGLVTGSLATLVAELKVDVIKIPELKNILSTAAGERKMIARFQAANAAKSVINTLMIDGNEEWQRIQTQLTGVPETMMAYMQIAAGAADIPATRFLGMSPTGLNATGDSDTRNYYDRLKAEQHVILTPAINVLDEVLIRSALGDRPPEVWYEWNSLWQLSDVEKAAVSLQKAQAYKIDVDAAQIPTTALANARTNQLIEDGTYPGLEKALEEAALEGDTIEEHNTAPPMDPLMEAQKTLAENGMAPPPGQPGGPPAGPPKGNVIPLKVKKPNPFAGDSFEDDDELEDDEDEEELDDYNENHDPDTGEFTTSGGGGSGEGGKEGDKTEAEKEGDKQAGGKSVEGGRGESGRNASGQPARGGGGGGGGGGGKGAAKGEKGAKGEKAAKAHEKAAKEKKGKGDKKGKQDPEEKQRAKEEKQKERQGAKEAKQKAQQEKAREAGRRKEEKKAEKEGLKEQAKGNIFKSQVKGGKGGGGGGEKGKGGEKADKPVKAGGGGKAKAAAAKPAGAERKKGGAKLPSAGPRIPAGTKLTRQQYAELKKRVEEERRARRRSKRDSMPDLFDINHCHEPDTGKFCSEGGGPGGAPGREAVPGYKTGEHAAGDGKEIKPTKEGWYDKNPNKDIPSAIKSAGDAQGRLGEIGEKIAKDHGVTFKNPGIKVDMDRIHDKAADRGGIDRVSDLFRGGFSIDHPSQADAIAKDLAKHYGTANENWKTTPEGYTDKAVSIRDKNGMVGEVQIAEKGMWHAKADVEKGGLGGHQKYKEAQKLDKAVRSGKSSDPTRDRARINELNRQMRDIYGGVLKSYGSDWKKAIGR
jgi:uncharacterized protein